MIKWIQGIDVAGNTNIFFMMKKVNSENRTIFLVY
jgi:hypothetical protein